MLVLDRFLESGPSLAERPEGARLTNLLGGNCVGVFVGFESIGAAEPLERLIDGESGPTLDLGLLWELGNAESLLIHDPLDDIESLLCTSSAGPSWSAKSADFTIDNLCPLFILGACGRAVGVC